MKIPAANLPTTNLQQFNREKAIRLLGLQRQLKTLVNNFVSVIQQYDCEDNYSAQSQRSRDLAGINDAAEKMNFLISRQLRQTSELSTLEELEAINSAFDQELTAEELKLLRARKRNI